MERRIIRVWESPTNEGTKGFTVGNKRPGRDWRVGRIEMLTLAWWQGSADEFKRFANSRVDVYDDDDNLRVSLPTDAVAVEYAKPGKE